MSRRFEVAGIIGNLNNQIKVHHSTSETMHLCESAGCRAPASKGGKCKLCLTEELSYIVGTTLAASMKNSIEQYQLDLSRILGYAGELEAVSENQTTSEPCLR